MDNKKGIINYINDIDNINTKISVFILWTNCLKQKTPNMSIINDMLGVSTLTEKQMIRSALSNWKWHRRAVLSLLNNTELGKLLF